MSAPPPDERPGDRRPPPPQSRPPAPYTGPPSPQAGWVPRPDPSVRSRALTALILNLLSVVLCCGVVGIAGAVVSGVAVGQVDRNPADARRMLTWAWILLAGSVVSGVLLGTFLAVVGLGSRTAGPGFACWGENNSCP